MSQSESHEQTRRRSLPIFVKCLIVLAGSSFLIAAAMMMAAEKGHRDIATFSIETLAKGLTEVSAEQVAGSLKFKDIEAIKTRLDGLVETTGMVQSYVLLDLDGQTIVSFPENIDLMTATSLTSLAGQTINADDTTSSEDGFSIAAPIRFGKKNTLAGGLAINWEPDEIFSYIEDQRLQNIVVSLILVLVLATAAGFLIRRMVTKPLEQISNRTVSMADGDLVEAVPQTSRGDEIGATAQAMEHLRAKLERAEDARLDAAFQRAGFQSTGTPALICDQQLVITHANAAFLRFGTDFLEDFQRREPGFDPAAMFGKAANIFHLDPDQARETMQTQTFPISAETYIGKVLVDLTINQVIGEDGTVSGYVVEYQNVTETRKTSAILSALEQAQLRADFDQNGSLVRLNSTFSGRFETNVSYDANVKSCLVDSEGVPHWDTLREGKSVFGRIHSAIGGQDLVIDGSISPIENKDGTVSGYVLLGTDVTAATQELALATEETERLNADQSAVDATMREALTKLSSGNLKFRIEDSFSTEYEPLRINFNKAVDALDDAISEILGSADTILGETDNVSSAADDLSKRTEQQAATLEETAAAISELTSSVASAASGASNAQDVVTAARDNAATSGLVVQQAVDAMGEIENSSDQISRIIGVIDEIAFQTNLLALNAGVEAARAGDAGRGFAVVASEVRSLAQRSSDAAHEITDLISTSGKHVKTGVALVGKAGQALSEIVESVGDIAEHVTAIASSTQEQSTGLDEINTAMNQLDQVTQKNVAMFEETMAATQTVSAEANTLVGVTGRFTCHGAKCAKPKSEALPSFESGRTDPARLTPQPSPEPKHEGKDRHPVSTQGNLALAAQEETFQDENWEEF